MGAHNIEFDIPDGPASKVREAFKSRREDDRACNGHQDGYSGDFQTVDDVEIHDKVFNDYDEAHKYCLDNAEKWSHVVAVKYRDFSHLKSKNNSVKFIKGDLVSKKLLTLKQRLDKEVESLETLRLKTYEAMKNAKSKTIGCKGCGSQINRQFVRQNMFCPVCSKATLMSATVQKQIENKKAKIKTLKNQVTEEESKLKTKNAKQAKLRWLIAGLGAC